MDLSVIEWLRRNPFAEAQSPDLPKAQARGQTQATPCIDINGQNVPVIIRRNARATRLTLRLAADGSAVRMTIPRWGRPSEALAFAEEKRGWIAERLAQVPPANPPQPGGTVTVQGVTLALAWDEKHPRRPEIARRALVADETALQTSPPDLPDGLRDPLLGELRVGGPASTLQQRVQRWLEARALNLFAADLVHYCQKARRPVPELRLSRAKRRWGSCASDGCIRINWRLVQAPDAVRRSVIAHEVAHLSHFDHSPAFHAHLAAIYEEDLPAADAWLKQHGRSLYAAFG